MKGPDAAASFGATGGARLGCGGSGGGGGIRLPAERGWVGLGVGDMPKIELPRLPGILRSPSSLLPGESPAMVALATGDRMRL